MNVLLVTDVYHPDTIGGAGRVAAELATGLARRGHAVRVVSRATPRALAPREERDGVTIFRYPIDARNPISFLGRTKAGIASCLFEALRGFVPDVLDLHQPYSASRTLAHPALRGIPSCYTFHSSWADELSVRGGWHRWMAPAAAPIERGALRAARVLVVLSEYSRRRVEEIVPAAPITIVPGGVDLEAFPARATAGTNDPPVILTIRNLVPRMGLEILLAAARELATAGERFELRIGGSGSLRESLERLAAPLGDRVRFLGRIPEEDLAAAYRAADLFVLPTTAIEGFGLVILEAFASGTPVLGTPVGAIAELVGLQGHGYVAAEATPGAVAASLRDLLGRIRSGRGLAKPETLRAIAERYSWDRRAAQVEELYRGLARSTPRGPRGVAPRP